MLSKDARESKMLLGARSTSNNIGHTVCTGQLLNMVKNYKRTANLTIKGIMAMTRKFAAFDIKILLIFFLIFTRSISAKSWRKLYFLINIAIPLNMLKHK